MRRCCSRALLLHADPGLAARCRRALGHAGLAGLCAAAIAGSLSRPHGLCPVSPSAPGNNLGAEVMTTTLCTDSPSGKRYDLAEIGAGSAGFSAAITAAEAGAPVALIGHCILGGTCINFGCVPSKTPIRCMEGFSPCGRGGTLP